VRTKVVLFPVHRERERKDKCPRKKANTEGRRQERKGSLDKGKSQKNEQKVGLSLKLKEVLTKSNVCQKGMQ